MDKQLVSQDKNVKKYLVQFDTNELQKAEKDVVKEVNKNYKFPGFRKGKAPTGIIKMKLGENYDNWINDILLEDAMKEIQDDEKTLFPPKVDSTANDEGKFEVEITVHAYPEVKSTDFENITVEIPKSESIIEKFVDDKLNELLDQNAILEPKEGTAEYDDFVRVTYTVKNQDGKVLQENKENEYTLREDDNRPIVTEVVGKSKGDVIEYEKDFEDKKYHYTVNLEDIYSRKIPELTEEFVKELDSDAQSLEELKDKFRSEGKEQYENWNKDFVRNYIIGELPEHTEIEISEQTIEEYVENYIAQLKKEGKYNEELEKNENDEEKMKENIKESSLKWIKELVVVDELAKENNIEVSDEEITNAIKNISQMWQMPYERTREAIYSNQKLLNDVVWDTLKSKVVDTIKDKVKIEEVDSEKFEKKETEE
ncbi:MAG: trigger factor [Thermotogota bacterium]